MSGLLKVERGSPDKQHTGLKTLLGLRHLTWLVTLICHFVSRLAKLCGCGEASQCPIVVRDFCACCLSSNSKNVVIFDRDVAFVVTCYCVLKSNFDITVDFILFAVSCSRKANVTDGGRAFLFTRSRS